MSYITLHIINCTFANNYMRNWHKIKHNNEILSTVSIAYAMRYFIFICNSTFIGNIALYGAAFSALLASHDSQCTIVSSKFINNSAVIEGGAIYATGSTISAIGSTYAKINVINCIFEGNFIANSYIGTILPAPTDSNIPFSQGRGGAIMFNEICFNITATNFTNNIASSYGGAICSVATRLVRTRSIIYGCVVVGVSKQTLFGILYLLGEIDFVDVNLTVKYSNYKGSAFFYQSQQSGSRDSAMVSSYLQLTCPRNNKPISEEKRIDRFTYAYFSLSCYPCDKGTYSITHGHKVMQTGINNTKSDRNGTTDMDCHPCPTGGVCEDGIISNDNYWGYPNEKNEVVFVICPPMYCCSVYGKQCSSYDTCEDNREGVLCGECMPGYSENILTTKCIKNYNCDDTMFWWLYGVGVLIYTTALIYFKQITDLFKTVYKHLKKQMQSMKRYEPLEELLIPQGNEVEGNVDDDTGIGPGMIKILMFFYQVQFLLQVKASSKKHYAISSLWADIISSIFNFNPSSSSKSFKLCAWKDMNAVEKQLIKLSIIISAFILLIVIYLLSLAWQRIIHYKFETLEVQNVDHNTELIPFRLKVKIAFLRLILFTYIPITSIALKMVHCVRIGNSSYLFIKGDVQCFHWWQYFTASLLIAWIAPFCVSLCLSANLLKNSKIEANQFIRSLAFPPLSIYYSLITKCVQNERNVAENIAKDTERKFLLQVFCQPFKGGYTKWVGMIVFRNFSLTIASVISNPVIRIYLMLLLLIVFELHHNKMQPYKSHVLNDLERFSLALLILLAGVNLFWAHSFISDITHMSTLHTVGEVFLYIEKIVLLIPAFALILSLIFVLFVQLYCLVKRCSYKVQNYLVNMVA